MERMLCLRQERKVPPVLASVLEPHGVWCARVIVFDCRERTGGVLEAPALCMRWEALKGPFFLSSFLLVQVPGTFTACPSRSANSPNLLSRVQERL